MSEKKFANLHYPGMKTDPNESPDSSSSELLSIPPEAMSYYESQVLTIGEKNQRKLLSSSVIFLDTSPMAMSVVKKLWEIGIGRVGFFGDSSLTAAHRLGDLTSESSAIAAAKHLQKNKYPWLTLELFRDESIDRSLDDIVLGFDIIFCSLDFFRNENRIRMYEKPVYVFHQNAKNWTGIYLPKKSVQSFQHKIQSTAEGDGIYFPLIDQGAHLVTAIFAQQILSTNEPEAQTHHLRLDPVTWLIEHEVVKHKN